MWTALRLLYLLPLAPIVVRQRRLRRAGLRFAGARAIVARLVALTLLALFGGFLVGALAAAVPALQAPAGPILCAHGHGHYGTTTQHLMGEVRENVRFTCTQPGGPETPIGVGTVWKVLCVEYGLVFVFGASLVLARMAARVPPAESRPERSNPPVASPEPR